MHLGYAYPRSPKTVTYVDQLIATSLNLNLNDNHKNQILAAIHAAVDSHRYRCLPMPWEAQAGFWDRYQSNRAFLPQELDSMIAATLLPRLIEILEAFPEPQVKQMVTESQKNAFIVLKAKELGVTATQLRQILETGFIYIPFISQYQNNGDIDIRCGMLWYHVVYGDRPGIEKIALLTTQSSGSFPAISHNITRNLSIKIRNLGIFRLQAPIAEIDNNHIKIPLYRKDGIHRDDPFYVGEWVSTSSGGEHFQKNGFVRLLTIAADTSVHRQFTTAYAVQRGNWSRGMMVIEHPRMHADIALKPQWFSLDFNPDFISFPSQSEEDQALYLEFKNTNVKGNITDFDVQLNLARHLQIAQFFWIAGIGLGRINVNSCIYPQEINNGNLPPFQTSQAQLYSVHTGFLKKHYFGAVALHEAITIDYQHLTYQNLDYKVFNDNLAFETNFGLEYAISIDWNIGVFLGYSFLPLSLWDVSYDTESSSQNNQYLGRRGHPYRYQGIFGIYIHYTPLTLNLPL